MAKRRLEILSNLTPPSLERTWLTAPHPHLPLVATCSSDKTVRIYSLSNFTLLSTISGGHKRSVRTCAWKPHIQGESVLATGSFDATVGIWRRWDSYGSEKAEWEVSAEPRGEADEQDEDEEWRFAVLLDGHDSEVKSVSWSPSGTLLATCSRDKSIWIWEDLDDGDNNFETVAVLQEHSGDVKCVAWHPAEDCLASASYDDTIRIWREDIDDWGQVACLKGHEGTVWSVDWEASDAIVPTQGAQGSESDLAAAGKQWREYRSRSGPRIVSCSDDRTIRVWRREPKERPTPTGSNVPSILRPTGIDETWTEEARLPKAHELSIYAVAWSKQSGLVASTGADGRVVVYQERFAMAAHAGVMDTELSQSDPSNTDTSPRTEWTVVATIDGTHGIYEVNHVCWAPRADKTEEMLLTTGDDGSVKAWTVAV